MIIWIASYPKSGNTWVRAFITSLLFKKEKGTSFKDLMHINIYPRRSLLKNYTNNFHDFEELSKYWLITQKDINKDNKEIFRLHFLAALLNRKYQITMDCSFCHSRTI